MLCAILCVMVCAMLCVWCCPLCVMVWVVVYFVCRWNDWFYTVLGFSFMMDGHTNQYLYSKVRINPLSWIRFFLNFSIKSWSNFKIRESFEFYTFSAFQNCPWFWILTKIWWRDWGKTGSNWPDWFYVTVLLFLQVWRKPVHKFQLQILKLSNIKRLARIKDFKDKWNKSQKVPEVHAIKDLKRWGD